MFNSGGVAIQSNQVLSWPRHTVTLLAEWQTFSRHNDTHKPVGVWMAMSGDMARDAVEMETGKWIPQVDAFILGYGTCFYRTCPIVA